MLYIAFCNENGFRFRFAWLHIYAVVFNVFQFFLYLRFDFCRYSDYQTCRWLISRWFIPSGPLRSLWARLPCGIRPYCCSPFTRLYEPSNSFWILWYGNAFVAVYNASFQPLCPCMQPRSRWNLSFCPAKSGRNHAPFCRDVASVCRGMYYLLVENTICLAKNNRRNVRRSGCRRSVSGVLWSKSYILLIKML